jgi:tetratricopeptide (TPR) repeat protein
MARADRRQAARQARRVERRPSAAGGGARIAEDTMFFPKLRAHARWMFVLLVFVFGAGFVFLGVGSGSSGIGDLLNGNWGSLFGSSNGTSAQVSKDRKLIAKNPKDWTAYKDLASALATQNKLDEAISTLETLKQKQPKDVDGLTQLASLYLRKADAARNDAAAIQSNQASLVGPTDFTPAGTSKVAEAYQSLTDPILAAVQNQSSNQLNTAYSKMTTAYSQATSAYQAVANLTPNDPSVQFYLGQTAEQVPDAATAIAAYKRFVKLAPDDPTTPVIKQHIKALEKQQASSPTASSTPVTTGG